jgi:putative hydrolase of the HAD superfamily
MPGMKNILMELKKRNKYLGIISNAQFYTPIIMNYFLSGKVSDDEYINMFDPELIRYSYKLKRAKPDIAMFEQTRENLARFGIMPHETLYIGNDMLKDVYPASKTGFRTVLFAGDRRSLKLRNEKPEISGLKPDFTIDNLEAVLRIAV